MIFLFALCGLPMAYLVCGSLFYLLFRVVFCSWFSFFKGTVSRLDFILFWPVFLVIPVVVWVVFVFFFCCDRCSLSEEALFSVPEIR
jgi:hypothetical protein